MTAKTSIALDRIAPSPTMAITALAAQMRRDGADVISLSVGEPDFDTPPHVIDAALKAMRDGDTRYTDVDGTPALKAAIVKKFQRDNGLSFQTSQISVNCGGKHSLFNALLATLDPGHEVIIPAPYWVSYPDIVRLAGATPVIVPTTAAQGYKLTPDALAAAITPRTRWLILNSPGNPTGAIYSAAELAALGAVLRLHPDVLILSDDIYEHIRYTPGPFATIAAVGPDLADRTLTVNGVSKGYAMTGWRIGFAGGPDWLIKAMAKLQSQSTSNPASISQAAAVAALLGPQDFLREQVAAYRERRDLTVAMINDTPGLSCFAPDGAFYVFVDCSGVIGKTTPQGNVLTDDAAVAAYLLTDALVAVVPGSAFGHAGAFRISTALAEDQLQIALERIQAAVVACVK